MTWRDNYLILLAVIIALVMQETKQPEQITNKKMKVLVKDLYQDIYR